MGLDKSRFLRREETVTGQRIRELLQDTPPVEVDHDFAAPLAGASSLEELVADAVVEVRLNAGLPPTHLCHVQRLKE